MGTLSVAGAGMLILAIVGAAGVANGVSFGAECFAAGRLPNRSSIVWIVMEVTDTEGLQYTSIVAVLFRKYSRFAAATMTPFKVVYLMFRLWAAKRKGSV